MAETTQPAQPVNPESTAKTPEVAEETPQTKALFDAMLADVNKEIDALKKAMNKIMASSGQEIAQAAINQLAPQYVRPESLPWFKYGLRGFLMKLWFGDHPDNPLYHPKNESFINLNYHNYMIEQIDLMSDIVFYETGLYIPSEYEKANPPTAAPHIPTVYPPKSPSTPPSMPAAADASKSVESQASSQKLKQDAENKVHKLLDDFKSKVQTIVMGYTHKAFKAALQDKEAWARKDSEPVPVASPESEPGKEYTYHRLPQPPNQEWQAAQKILEDSPIKAKVNFYREMLRNHS